MALRARGGYFLMITLALAQVVWGVAVGWRTMTGGDDGLPNVARPCCWTCSAAAPPATTISCSSFTIAAVWMMVALIKSKFG